MAVLMTAAMSRLERVARILLPALAASLILAAGAAWACPICFSGRVVPLGQKIDAADVVILATPLGDAGPYRVVKAIKGTTSVGTMIVDVNPPSPALVVPRW